MSNIHNSNHDLIPAPSCDARWQAVHFGLCQLTNEQLFRILHHVQRGGRMVCDAYNYDPSSDSWCPLAVGLGIPDMVAASPQSFTNDSAKALITEIGRRTCPTFSLNPISGVPGSFFRDDRVNEILSVCQYILAERSVEHQKAA